MTTLSTLYNAVCCRSAPLQLFLCVHTFAWSTRALRASGACSLHTTYSNTLLNIKGNYPSPQCTDLSEFLNQKNGLWTRQIPPGPVSKPLPGTLYRIRPVIPTFRFPLIWSWHRGEGLLCISPPQDGGLFTWSPPDWIWSVALLHRPRKLRQEKKKSKVFFFSSTGYLLHYRGWNILHSGIFTVAFQSGKAWWIRVADITPLLRVPLMKSNFLFYFYFYFFTNVTAEIERSSHLSLLTDSTNVKKTAPPPPEPFWTNVRNTSEQCSIWNSEPSM